MGRLICFVLAVCAAHEPLYSCIWYTTKENVFECVKAEPAELTPGSQRRYTNVIGIGPPKSGTSSLGGLLTGTGIVLLGDRNVDLNPWPGVQTELNWLQKEPLMSQGISTLAHYYDKGANDSTKTVFFEKDPKYFQSMAPVAAYRARAFLGPNLKVIHTTRDLLDLDGSLYLYRNTHKFNVSYREWVEHRMESFKNNIGCRNVVFDEHIVPAFDGTKVSIDNLHNSTFFSWEAASTIEAELLRRCGPGQPYRVNHISDTMAGIFEVSNLRRWVHAFPNYQENLHCIDVNQRANEPEAAYTALFEFIGADLTSVHDYLKQVVDEVLSRTDSADHHPSSTTFDRVVESQRRFEGDRAEKVVTELRQRIQEVVPEYVPCEHVHWYRMVCGYVPTGYEHCTGA